MVEPAVVRVVVHWKQGLGTNGLSRKVVWPIGWPLPEHGDMVHLDTGEGGFVTHLSYDLGAGIIGVFLR